MKMPKIIRKFWPALSTVDNRGSWWPIIREANTGDWQKNVEVSVPSVTAYWAVFACVTLIAKDVSKMTFNIHNFDPMQNIWKKTNLRARLIRKPNHYQTRAEFMFYWILSKLLAGNTYVLKERDAQGFVVALYVLDPNRVTPLVAPNGDVYYQLQRDDLSHVNDDTMGDTIAVPATEIIHDKMYTLFHPLVGVSPIYACGVAAMQGTAIQNNSTKFFQNMSVPGGVLTAPGPISTETAERLQTKWQTNYTGANAGRVAVLGDGLKYETMTIAAADAQMIEQFRMTGEVICSCYHVPGYKIGVGSPPPSGSTSALNQQYFDQCVHWIIETVEQRLDDGLELPSDFYETRFDVSELIRMDPDARYKSHSEAVKGGWASPDEVRMKEDMPPVPGGGTPYMQQQNYSLAALGARDKNALVAYDEKQMASLQEMLQKASDGSLPVETVRAMLALAFPGIPEAQIQAMLDPIEDEHEEAEEATAPQPALPPPPAPAEPEGDEDEDAMEEQVASFLAAVNKNFEAVE